MRASMYPEKPGGATGCRAPSDERLPMLRLLKLCVPFDKLFRPAPWKAYGYPAVLIVAFDTHDRSHSVAGMPHFAAEHGIGVAAFGGWPPERTRAPWSLGCRGGRLRSSGHPPDQFFSLIGLPRFV